MPHISGESREPGVDILAVAIPFEKAMDGKRVALMPSSA